MEKGNLVDLELRLELARPILTMHADGHATVICMEMALQVLRETAESDPDAYARLHQVNFIYSLAEEGRVCDAVNAACGLGYVSRQRSSSISNA